VPPWLNSTCGAGKIAGDHANVSRSVLECDGGDTTRRDLLISRGGHLVGGGQIDPKLHQFEKPAICREAFAMELLVDHTRRGCHPLDVTRSDGAVVAGRVAVIEFAVVDDGDRLEPAMRMLPHAPAAGRRREFMGARVVEQQKRTRELGLFVVGKQRTDGETVPHPVLRNLAANGGDLFRRRHPRIPPD
jgi:hypothetical protein